MKILNEKTVVPIYSCKEAALVEKLNTPVAVSSDEGGNSNLIPPVGFVYIQFPNKQSPSTIYPSYTWTNITDQYAGAFFRFEGGNASTFESGLQDDATATTGLNTSFCSCPYNNTHCHPIAYCNTGNGVAGSPLLYAGQCYVSLSTTICYSGSSTNSTSDSGAHTHGVTLTGGTETRPINYTVRLWERTA